MPIYTYKHTCGMEQELYLKADKEHLPVDCSRCGRTVMARQKRDSSLKFGEADGTIGVLQRERATQRKR